jgi:nucleoside-diphosphate-sugar epimerase
MLSISSSKNQEFIEKFHKDKGYHPTWLRGKSYTATMFWAEAVKKAGSTDPTAVIAWAIEFALKGLPYTLECNPETRCTVLYFKDTARAFMELSAADAGKIQTRIYNLSGITPPFSAQELVEAIAKQIPGARLAFDPDPVVVELLRELGALKINDDCARAEWGMQTACSLDAMIEDFCLEF